MIVELAFAEGWSAVDLTYHRLQEVQRKWPNQSHHDNILASHLLGHQLRLTLQLHIAGDLAQAACSTDKDIVGACFRKKEEKEDETEATEPHEHPDRPGPIK